MFLRNDREWNEQIRDGDDGGNPRRPHRLHWEKVQGILLLKQDRNQTSIPTTSASTTTLPHHLRVWIDVEPGQYNKSCFEVSKKMIRLLRHNPSSTSRSRRSSRIQNLGTDVSFRIQVFSALVNSTMAELRAKRRRTRFQYCVDPHSADTILFFQGNSRPF